MKRFSLVAFLIGTIVTLVRADTLVATKQRAWEKATVVSQAFVTKNFDDRGLYIVVTDPSGRSVQINRELVVATLQLPELKTPDTITEDYELGVMISLQANLVKLSSASPKIKLALAPFQAKFDASIKLELEKFKADNVKIAGVWMTRTKHEADLATVAKARQVEQEKQEARVREEQLLVRQREAAALIAENARRERDRKESEERAARDREKAFEERKIASAEEAKNAEAERARERRSSASGGTLNGYSWRSASMATRMAFCHACAARVQSRKPSITGGFIFDSLQEFYTSTDQKILGTSAADIAALTIAAY